MATTTRRTNVTLWVLQSLLAALFLFAGASKFALPAAVLSGPLGLPIAFIRFIGVCEIAGALGLVLPGIFRVRMGLTPLAAVGLICIMAGATTVSIEAMGIAAGIVPAVTGIIAAVIAVGRRERLARVSGRAAWRGRIGLAHQHA